MRTKVALHPGLAQDSHGVTSCPARQEPNWNKKGLKSVANPPSEHKAGSILTTLCGGEGGGEGGHERNDISSPLQITACLFQKLMQQCHRVAVGGPGMS